jgi:putative peptidoglycan lipid II flippase
MEDSRKPITAHPVPAPESLWRRAAGLLRPRHRHSVFSATVLLMASTFLSGVMGLVRSKYIAYLFGASVATDAYNAAFQLPDMIAYFLVGGTASITFIAILSRYRESGDEADGERALSVILTVMVCVLFAAAVLGAIFAPVYVRIFMPRFTLEEAALCTRMTRIMLPQPIFFFVGGVFGSFLLVRKVFTFQAVSPLVYNVAIILAGVLLARSMGVSSLAVGVVVGAFLGYLMLNLWGAYRIGVRFRLSFDLAHPGLREWIRLSLPLMLGVTVVTADRWILNYFASGIHGQISRLTYAKSLFTAPMAVLGQAAGAASLPFFASLFNQGRLADFASAVNSSVSRVLIFSFLLSAWMIGLAYPAVDFIFRGGSFHSGDSVETAHYFAIFAVSLFLWTGQAIYARAFYAAGDTLTPMAAGVIVTLVSLPVYWLLYHAAGTVGLSLASDIAILFQTAALALLLNKRRIVPLRTRTCRTRPCIARHGCKFGGSLRSALSAAVQRPHRRCRRSRRRNCSLADRGWRVPLPHRLYYSSSVKNPTTEQINLRKKKDYRSLPIWAAGLKGTYRECDLPGTRRIAITPWA